MSRRVKKKSFPRKDKRQGVKRKISNIPDHIDIDIKHQDYLKFSKSLDEDGRPPQLTEIQLRGLIRNAIRKKWMSCNTKLAFLESRRTPDTEITSRRMWKWRCEMCGDWFKQGEVDVDHKDGEKSYTNLEDTLEWARSILDAGGDQDLSILCSDKCHPLKTIMESHGLSLEEAQYFKDTTTWEKSMKVPEQKAYLIEKGFPEEEVSNKEKRRASYTSYIKSLDK